MYKGLVTLVLLTGCATPKVYDVIQPPQFTVNESRQHLAECRLQSRIVLPGTTPNIPAGGGFWGGYAHGAAAGSPQAGSRVVYDTAAIVNCMEAKGYRFEPRGNREQLPDTEWVPPGYRLVR